MITSPTTIWTKLVAPLLLLSQIGDRLAQEFQVLIVHFATLGHTYALKIAHAYTQIKSLITLFSANKLI